MFGSDCILMENLRVGYTSAINRDVESIRMLHGLSNTDPKIRRQVFEAIVQLFTDWLNGQDGSRGKQRGRTTYTGYDWNDEFRAQSEKTVLQVKQILREQLPDILRLQFTCPFADVRERCSSMLEDMQVCRLSSHIVDQC